MTNKEMEDLTNRIQEKIGKEASSLIADDIGLLITDTSKMNEAQDKSKNEIVKLKEQKEKLIETNGNLLQQISVGEEVSYSPKVGKNEDNEPTQKLNFRDSFDERGNFKR